MALPPNFSFYELDVVVCMIHKISPKNRKINHRFQGNPPDVQHVAVNPKPGCCTEDVKQRLFHVRRSERRWKVFTKSSSEWETETKKTPCWNRFGNKWKIEIKAELMKLSLLSCRLPGTRMKKFCLFAAAIKFVTLFLVVSSQVNTDISAILCQGSELQPDCVTVPVHLITKDLKLQRICYWKNQTDKIKKQSRGFCTPTFSLRGYSLTWVPSQRPDEERWYLIQAQEPTHSVFLLTVCGQRKELQEGFTFIFQIQFTYCK